MSITTLLAIESYQTVKEMRQGWLDQDIFLVMSEKSFRRPITQSDAIQLGGKYVLLLYKNEYVLSYYYQYPNLFSTSKN